MSSAEFTPTFTPSASLIDLADILDAESTRCFQEAAAAHRSIHARAYEVRMVARGIELQDRAESLRQKARAS